MSISFKKTFYVLASVFGVILLLYLGRSVLVPVAFGLLISFILYPICIWLERKGTSRVWAILWTMLSVFLIIFGITFLFSAQIINIVKEFDSFGEKLNEVLIAITTFLNERLAFIPKVSKESITDMVWEWFSSKSGGVLSNTTKFLTGFTLTIIYSFLFLLYRKDFKKGLIRFTIKKHRAEFAKMIGQIQQVGQQYLTGMFALILMLGILNSLGLFALGIDYAFFFGFLAAFLAIIPYVGTTIGGMIPTIYAFMNFDSYWYPLGVILIFWVIQFLEGNFLNPKIVGGNLNINAFASILVLIVGSFIWGLAGMILFLPYLAVFKVICDHYDQLKPVSMLIGDEGSKYGDGLKNKFNKMLGKEK